jgi:hypothetical protein
MGHRVAEEKARLAEAGNVGMDDRVPGPVPSKPVAMNAAAVASRIPGPLFLR